MSREDRIADLEAALSAATGQCAALDKEKRALEAKLARVREWAIANDDEDYIDILSDTRQPLAVIANESAEKDGRGFGTITYSLPYLILDDPYETMPKHLPVTVIVMPKEDQ